MAAGAHRWTATALAVVLGLGALGACTKDSGSKTEFCRQIKRAPALGTVVSGFADTDRSTLDDRLDDVSKAYAALRDAAPDDVRGDVNEMSDLVDALVASIRAHPDDPEAAADAARKAVVANPGGVTSAVKVTDYASKQCGVQLNPTVEGATTTSVAAVTTTTGG